MNSPKTKALSLSVILPVYNEERRIATCLEALLSQELPVSEIILVDNNCSDNTVGIARRYKKITIVQEPKQGLIAARNLGFNTARGDILARIDADTVVDPDWSKQILATYTDNSVAAASGDAKMDIFPGILRRQTTLYSRLYFIHVFGYFRFPILWGANMSIRKVVWEDIKDMCSLNDNLVHEDQDISGVLFDTGYTIVHYNKAIVSADAAAYTSWSKYMEYQQRKRRTRSIQRSRKTRRKYPIGIMHAFLLRTIAFIPSVFVSMGIALYSVFYKTKRLLFKK